MTLGPAPPLGMGSWLIPGKHAVPPPVLCFQTRSFQVKHYQRTYTDPRDNELLMSCLSTSLKATGSNIRAVD